MNPNNNSRPLSTPKESAKTNRFINTKANLNSLVGFELWEILTMLTVVLSLASGIMWYSNFQPKQMISELAIIENQKHILFSQYTVSQSNLDKQFTTLNVQKDCKLPLDDKENQLNTLDLDIEMGKLQTFGQNISTLKKDMENLIKIDPLQKFTPRLLDSYSTYLAEVQNLRQDQYQFKRNLFDAQQVLRTICNLDFAYNNEHVVKLENLSTNLQNYKSANVETLNKYLEEFYALYSMSAPRSETDSSKLGRLYDVVFSLEYDTKPFLYLISTESEEFISAIKSTENQEREILKNNADLDGKVIYIY